MPALIHKRQPSEQARAQINPPPHSISEPQYTPAIPVRHAFDSSRPVDRPLVSSTPSVLPPNGPTVIRSYRQPSPSPDRRGRSVSAQPRSSLPQPASRAASTDALRNISSPVPRALSKTPDDGESRGRLRKSWMPGSSRSGSKDLPQLGSVAWIISPQGSVDYNASLLTNGDKIPELWDESGDLLIHLSSRASGHPPQIRLHSRAIASSAVLQKLLEVDQTNSFQPSRPYHGTHTLSVDETSRFASPPPTLNSTFEKRIYVPLPSPSVANFEQSTEPSLDRLIAIRNLFAFLSCLPLVANKSQSTIFASLMQISDLLSEFQFMGPDGSSWGPEVDQGAAKCVQEWSLADVRDSREKTIEAVILGERLRYLPLYYEAFTHAVGMYTAIVDLKSPLFKVQISAETRTRLERAHIDLLKRQKAAELRLEDFEFPSLFAGIANSSAYKDTNFARWKMAFLRMRSFVLGYYKDLFGSWPPRARSKKNPFSVSGLNRQVLRTLYSDLCSLYDLLVDRELFTTRVFDDMSSQTSLPGQGGKAADILVVLRALLNEFDHSSPPVSPPIPFDVPKIPSMTSILATYDGLKEKAQTKFDKSLKSNELILLMRKSYNFDADSLKTPFLNGFRAMDLREAKGKSAAELADERVGTWLFLYVVIQSMPMLLVDAPDLKFADGVESFLCEPPQGSPPWAEDVGVKTRWYQVAGKQMQIELSPDSVMFSVAGVFERSHCWVIAKQWEEARAAGLPFPPPMAHSPLSMSPLEAPRAIFENHDRRASPTGLSSNGSAPPSPAQMPQRRPVSSSPGLAAGRGSGHASRSSFIGTGLEPLPAPITGDMYSLPSQQPHSDRSSRVFSDDFDPRLAWPPAHDDSTNEYRTVRARPASGSRAMLNQNQSFEDALPANAMAHVRHASRGSHTSDDANRWDPAPPRPLSADRWQRNATPPPHSRQSSSTGITFDDILKDIDTQVQKKPKKKFGF